MLARQYSHVEENRYRSTNTRRSAYQRSMLTFPARQFL